MFGDPDLQDRPRIPRRDAAREVRRAAFQEDARAPARQVVHLGRFGLPVAGDGVVGPTGQEGKSADDDRLRVRAAFLRQPDARQQTGGERFRERAQCEARDAAAPCQADRGQPRRLRLPHQAVCRQYPVFGRHLYAWCLPRQAKKLGRIPVGSDSLPTRLASGCCVVRPCVVRHAGSARLARICHASSSTSSFLPGQLLSGR